MAITKLVRKTARFCYFILIIIGVGHLLPGPETYINYDFASQICDFLYGSVNADSMYDTFSYIDWIIILVIALIIYLSTKMLMSKTRNK
ncbi:hypothetical protein SAMN05192562_10174 [Kosakonia arachidis]|uniref:Uncharacterized protein n=1 Tax=Kosakonia arachidis TaxID=551989 RepID=A0A1I6XME1_9ENTR|nr:hypothetical protein SAMN05192562_10174 [Kosakonia arachidis]